MSNKTYYEAMTHFWALEDKINTQKELREHNHFHKFGYDLRCIKCGMTQRYYYMHKNEPQMVCNNGVNRNTYFHQYIVSFNHPDMVAQGLCKNV